MRSAWTRASVLIAIGSAACLIAGILSAALRPADSPAGATALGRQLAGLEETVQRGNVYPFNPRPDAIAMAYRTTVGAGEALVVVHSTYHGFNDRDGGGIVDLAQDSSSFVGTVSGIGRVEVRVVRGNVYRQHRLPSGELLPWTGVARTAFKTIRVDRLASAPVKALELLGRLQAPVRHAEVRGPGFAPCRGLVAVSDTVGANAHRTPFRTGVCLDNAGRIVAVSLRITTSGGIDTISFQLSHFGVSAPIEAPTRNVLAPASS